MSHKAYDWDINAAMNIRNIDQMNVYGQKITSHATGEGAVELPVALMKMTSKTEMSSNQVLVGHGMEQV